MRGSQFRRTRIKRMTRIDEKKPWRRVMNSANSSEERFE